jgi:hypothetical protein
LRADASVGRVLTEPTMAFRCLLTPSGPGSRHRKIQTSGPLCRFSRCTLPCWYRVRLDIASPFQAATDAFIEEAREAVLHTERAVTAATAVFNGADEIFNLGKSAYTEPFLVSAILSIRLPLFPGMRIKQWSNYSNELARQVISGDLDAAGQSRDQGSGTAASHRLIGAV